MILERDKNFQWLNGSQFQKKIPEKNEFCDEERFKDDFSGSKLNVFSLFQLFPIDKLPVN